MKYIFQLLSPGGAQKNPRCPKYIFQLLSPAGAQKTAAGAQKTAGAPPNTDQLGEQKERKRGRDREWRWKTGKEKHWSGKRGRRK